MKPKVIGHVHVKLPPDLKDSFQQATKDRGLTESLVLRRLIERWLNNEIKLEIE
jgi:predicted DNA-binding protein